jgi:hypothetical protein
MVMRSWSRAGLCIARASKADGASRPPRHDVEGKLCAKCKVVPHKVLHFGSIEQTAEPVSGLANTMCTMT